MTLMQAHPLAPAIQRTEDHHYYYEGHEYPSVTNVLKVLDKSDALMTWAARQTAEAALALMQDDSAWALMMGTVGPEGTIKALTARSSWKRDEAAQLGTRVHELADLVVRGEPTPPIAEAHRKRVLAYAEWWKASGWALRLSEAYVVAPPVEGAHTGYAGTFDLLARDRDGKTVLADVKTGRGIYREAILQLAAYGMAPLVARPTDERTYPMPHVDRHVILHVTDDGVREVELSVGAYERMAFLACLDLYGWTQSVKGRRL